MTNALSHVDTIVIGAGLSGLTAALRQIQSGRRTLLLAKGMGALSWSGGWIDVWPTPHPLTALSALPDTHPYQRAGLDAVPAALAWLQSVAQAANQPLAGGAERSLLVPTATGSWHPVALLPISMTAATPPILKDRSVLVVGFRELRDFYPSLVADRLRQRGIDAQGVYVPLPPTERHDDWSALHIARLFDQPAFRQAVATAIQHRRGAAQVILLPAIVGLSDHANALHDLQTVCGTLVAEIPTLPTVIPGLRLERMLRAAFERLGGRLLLNAEVFRGEWAGPRLRAVWSRAAARSQRHTAESFILATGGIGGGGLRADYPLLLRETALDLPVQQPLSHEDWFAPEFHAAQPIFTAGIAVTTGLHPLDPHGRPIPNLRVAGAALGGADLIRQRCRNGVALVTGWAAGHPFS